MLHREVDVGQPDTQCANQKCAECGSERTADDGEPERQAWFYSRKREAVGAESEVGGATFFRTLFPATYSATASHSKFIAGPDLVARIAVSRRGIRRDFRRYFAYLRKSGLRFSFSALTPSRDSSVS